VDCPKGNSFSAAPMPTIRSVITGPRGRGSGAPASEANAAFY
jgi:hypothetical protein